MKLMDGKKDRIEEIKPKLNFCIREPNLLVLNKYALLCSLKENKFKAQEDVLH